MWKDFKFAKKYTWKEKKEGLRISSWWQRVSRSSKWFSVSPTPPTPPASIRVIIVSDATGIFHGVFIQQFFVDTAHVFRHRVIFCVFWHQIVTESLDEVIEFSGDFRNRLSTNFWWVPHQLWIAAQEVIDTVTKVLRLICTSLYV